MSCVICPAPPCRSPQTERRHCASLHAGPEARAYLFGFIAQPRTHFFLKPNVTRVAAREYGYELPYRSRPSCEGYAGVLDFARTVRRDVTDLRPRDMIDIQSFIRVQGSEEYS